MKIHIQGAREHNLQEIDIDFEEGLTVVTGVSGSGKTSLVFDTLYHEARRRFLDIYSLGNAASRLSPANVEEITGLGPAVAVGQNLLNRNPASTLATASGLHPFLRLLFAHFGERTCARCGTPLQVYTEDELIEQLVEMEGPVSISALLLHGVKGSHSTLLPALVERFGAEKVLVNGKGWQGEKLDAAKSHDIELVLEDPSRLLELNNRPGDTPNAGKRSSTEMRSVVRLAASLGVLAVVVRGGKLETDKGEILSRAPVCTSCGTWFGELSPVQFNRPCAHCEGKGCESCSGTGLPPEAAAVRWGGLRFSELLELPVDEAVSLFSTAKTKPATPRLRTEIVRRLEALQRVGLGYISLNRSSPTLSRGEAQRVRLALTLISRLEDMLHVLDEPTIGQHPADVQRLLPIFRELPGPVIYVEHDRVAAAGADHAMDIGPGAGHLGGQVIYSGTPGGLWKADTATGRFFSQRKKLQPPERRPAPKKFLTISGANLRNLQQIDVPIPLERLTVICGVSGSGKSTLVEDVLVASIDARKPVGCKGILIGTSHTLSKLTEGKGTYQLPYTVVMVDQSPIGRNPRSNPATYTKLADTIRDFFASRTGFSTSHFSFNRDEGACPTCSGLGAVEVSMRYLPSTWIPCSECDGQRFTDEVLDAKVQIDESWLSIADFYALSIADARDIFTRETRIKEADRKAAMRILDALVDIGLGYLPLGQPSPTLSGGEAQRVKLARYLGSKSLTKEILVLDEPSTGLHPQDLAGLITVLDRLVRAGATVVIVEHNTDIIRAADWVIDLGPGAGPRGGHLLYAGPPDGLLNIAESQTAKALREEDTLAMPGNSDMLQPIRSRDATQGRKDTISIRGARVHNLQNVNVELPKGAFTVVTGVSGSGKSSLVSDVLEAEAQRRFLETLSLYERQGMREGPEAEVESVSGLGVALTIGPERLVYNRRATVGTATEIIHNLAVLMASLGERKCLSCGGSMRRGTEWYCTACGAKAPIASSRHFASSTYAAACIRCNGVGVLQVPNPSKLIIRPEKPLVNGAMYSPGFYPNGYLGKPFNGGYYMLVALGEHYGFDPQTTTWSEMTPEAQQAFLFGSEVVLTIHYESRTGRTNTYQSKFPGFYGFIRDWDIGGTYTDSKACPVCEGGRLRPEYLAVTLGGYNIHQLSLMTLEMLKEAIEPVEAIQRNLRASLQATRQRLQFLIEVGLGYLHLDRVAGTLSAGEAQRIRLAGLLGSGLTSLTLLLDEPTRGLHPSEVAALIQALHRLRDEGNTVITVEHDPQVMRAADYLVDCGPGAGQLGGKIVGEGTPEELAQMTTITGRWLRGDRQMELGPRRKPEKWLTILGARANNLKGERIEIPLGVLTGVCGVSGSGKSTLIVDTLGRVLAPKKQTTSVAYLPVDPGEYEAIEGAPARTLLIDQSRAGVHSPVSFLDLLPALRASFAASEEAKALGITEERLSERCSMCGGSGVITLDMTFLPDVHLLCETCRGTGYVAEAWEVHLRGVTLPDIYSMTIDQVYELFGDDERISRSLQAARDVGLGYLVLRQPGYSLSGGEAQRLKVAQELLRGRQGRNSANTLYVLDEPSVGQHLEDVARLVSVLHRLVDEGGSVLVVEHHAHLLAACDWLVELGPVGGPEGGYVIASGTPENVAAGYTPTAAYLSEVLDLGKGKVL